ncbi:MAG: LPS export ABC transporter permease LptG [Desulfobacteraceae bacterium]|nr:MAG: LPS export ABC transporter permease LptG [Desulfobacteraceae bacterium]
MSVIHKYITRLFFKYFGMVMGLVIAVYLSIDFFSRIDKFLEAGIPSSLTLAFFLYKIPLIVSQITPIAVLLGVLTVFGLMSKNNEILALKSGGISAYYLLQPMVAIGMVLSILLFVFSEAVVPMTVIKSNRIEEKTSKKNLMTSRGKNIWIRGDRTISHITYYNPSDKTISGISVAWFNQDFVLTGRINARKGEYLDGRWVFYDCLIQERLDISPENRHEDVYDGKMGQLDLLPKDLLRVAIESEELPFFQLYRYIRKVESQGYDATKYRVDFYAKTAFPCICLIMTLFASGLALRGTSRDGITTGYAYGILAVLVYWLFYSFCLSLGYGSMLPPLIAAWTANLIFLCASGLAVYNLE